jgi:hypothetical protein
MMPRSTHDCALNGCERNVSKVKEHPLRFRIRILSRSPGTPRGCRGTSIMRLDAKLTFFKSANCPRMQKTVSQSPMRYPAKSISFKCENSEMLASVEALAMPRLRREILSRSSSCCRFRMLSSPRSSMGFSLPLDVRADFRVGKQVVRSHHRCVKSQERRTCS